MILRQFLHADPVAASYLFGCGGKTSGAVVDPVGDPESYIEAAAKIAQRYNVMSIPTVILFERGQPVERMLGAKRKTEYQNVLNKRLNG